jgi:glycosyl transferase family 25
MIPIFIISLQHATQKQEQVSKHMQNLGIQFEFVWGVDGRLLSEEELQKVFDKKKSYDYYKWYRNRTGVAGVELSRGEIGCVLARRKVFQKVVDENIEQAIVLEDDVLVTEDFLSIIEKIVTSLKFNSLGKNLVIKLDNTLRVNHGYYKKIRGFLNDFLRPVQIRIDKELAIVKTPMAFGGAQGYYIDNAAARTMLSLNYPIFISDAWNYYARFVTVRALNKNIAPCRIESSDIWSKGKFKIIPVPIKYRYIGLLKKMIVKIYLLLWR